MKVGIIQVKVDVDVSKSIEFVDKMIQKCKDDGAEIIILPEMWNIPYHNELIKDSIKYHQTCFDLLKYASYKHDVIIVGGTIARVEDGRIYNSCHIFDAGKHICTYDKIHLFEVHTSSGISYQEKDVFTKGDKIKTFDTKFGKFGILVCYDIRFPEVSRILAQNGAKVIFCPAAFNKTVGQIHWQPLLQTRAMENQVFIVGINPQNYEHKTFKSYGHSMIVDPFGKVLVDADQEDYVVYDINLDEVDKIRKQMPFWQIRRTDIYEVKEII